MVSASSMAWLTDVARPIDGAMEGLLLMGDDASEAPVEGGGEAANDAMPILVNLHSL